MEELKELKSNIKNKKTKKVIKGVLIALILLVLSTGLRLGYMKIVYPINANIRRDVFENNNSYNRGKIQQLSKLKYEYHKGSHDDKEAIKALVRIEFANFDKTKLEPDLRNFVNTCLR